MIDIEITKSILSSWEADQNHPLKGRRQSPLPDLYSIHKLIDTAFIASIKTEEGKLTKASLILAKQDETVNSFANTGSNFINIHQPFDLTPHSITKFSPALDPAISSMLISEDGQGKLICWGIATFCKNTHRFNEIPFQTKFETNYRPDSFIVTIRAPGSIQISRSNFRIGRIIDGTYLPALPKVFSSKALGKYILQMLNNMQGGQYSPLIWHTYRDFIDVLISEAAERGHGATIIIIPPEQMNMAANHYEAHYSFDDRIDTMDMIRRHSYSIKREVGYRISYAKLLLERIQRTAQYSAIDGALLLTSSLNIISFGTKLKAPPWPKGVETGPNGFGQIEQAPFNSNSYGTRHKSAIDFIGACRGCIGFVISQDGQIRGFANPKGNSILYWPDCTETVFY